MQYRRLGKSNLFLSSLSLGTWPVFGSRITRAEAAELVAHAFDNGINFFDSAESYSSGEAEKSLGAALKAIRVPRDAVCIASKAFFGTRNDGKEMILQRGPSKKHITEACNSSLLRFGLDYIDFYYCHAYESSTNIEEVAWAMHCLILQGKILYWGTSNWPVDAITAINRFTRDNHLVPPSSNQLEYNILRQSIFGSDLVDAIETYTFGLIGYSPLMQGILAGRYDNGIPSDSRFADSSIVTLKDKSTNFEFLSWLAISRKLRLLAEKMEITQAQLAIAWCLRNRYINSVILGCSKRGQLDDCLTAVDVISRLDSEIWLEIAELGHQKPQ